MMITVAVQSDVAKRCPKMVRGTLMAVLGSLYAVGCVLYLLVSGYLMAVIGPNMCFLSIIGFNFITLAFIVVQIKRKKFGRKIKVNDGTSNDDSDKT